MSCLVTSLVRYIHKISVDCITRECGYIAGVWLDEVQIATSQLHLLHCKCVDVRNMLP